MECDIAADSPLDCVKFQILEQDRYEAYICSNEKEEMVGDVSLDHILQHLPIINYQFTQGSHDIFKLEFPDTVDNHTWFTKATLMRFLQMLGSPDLLKKSVAISNEMSQLEEAKKFHLSLYAQAEDGNASSDSSKNELLRAIHSRLAALTEELVSTFKLAAGDAFYLQEMLDLEKFCQQFADEDTRNMLVKVLEASRKSLPVKKNKTPIPSISKEDFLKKKGGKIQESGISDSSMPVKYNASPAKAAEIERHSSSESEDSSFSSSDDDQPPAERSRTIIRSATPRRSASPMRRVQIGRSGSRRTPALTIKSLTHFPARERISSYRGARDDDDDESDESEEPSKKTEVNVTRISVQDAISLFERKQKDQTVDTQKKPVIDNSTNANKTVLRRWSAGMGDTQNFLAQHLPEDMGSDDNAQVVDEDAQKSNVEKANEDCVPGNCELDTLKVDTESEANGKVASNCDEDDVKRSQVEESSEKLESAEWSRQKEAELNQMLMKFAEYNQINVKNTKPDNRRKSSSLVERTGGLYGHSKERKGEKIRGENTVKRVVKPAEVKTKQKIQDKPKLEKSPLKVSEVAKKNTTSKTQNVNKSMPLASNSKKEPSKPALSKKGPPKSAPLPATRKSWPSTPSPRATGTLPSKIPTVTPPPRATALRQKTPPPASLSKPTPHPERSQIHQKDVKKPPQVDSKRSLKKVHDSQSRVVPKTGKTAKTKPVVASKEDAISSPAKPVVRKKVTKKSSVVPLEAKPEDRKVSNIKTKSKSTVQKKEIPRPPPEKTFTKPEEPVVDTHENVEVTITETVYVAEGVVQALETQNDHLDPEKEMETEKPTSDSSNEVSVKGLSQVDEAAERESDSLTERETQMTEQSEPPLISPAAWVEESNDQDPSIPNGNSSGPSPANHNAEASSGTRVRHSLSQMLLQETSEPDVIEWGNAENPPTMVYQKDAPKGLKRLLKFARKNKGESNSSLWSSPYASEAEDDGDEYKSLGKRNSDNLLKVALHSKNYGEGLLSDSEPLSARSNASNSSARSSKGSRSFFSLSAFRGNKN